MYSHYRHKIKTIDELCILLGPRPRQKKVIMCHGVFDIVHPGHIRHLLYAGEQGDVLVASVTTDAFVSKGEERPYVPQNLRAASLAALEVIDYVLLSDQLRSVQTILSLQPDFFVKGFEYSRDGIHPVTRDEVEAVKSYGGQFLFSPGDVVYSSTDLLAQHRPELVLDKLAVLMQAEGVTFDDLRSTLQKMAGVSVHVVGDTIVDKYSHCSLLGPTRKTPTFSVKLERSRFFVGGAGIVAKHLRGLGAEVELTTILGDDEPGAFVQEDLARWQVKANVVTERHRPTTTKERFWAAGYNLLRVDTLDNSPTTEAVTARLADSLRQGQPEVIIFSDFRHGVFHADSIPVLIDAIPSGALRAADSQVTNRWGNILDFKGFDFVTPNEREARFALADQDSGVRHLAQRLYSQAQARNLILKLGERGILAYRQPCAHPRSFFHLDSFVENLIDALGAGDALLAASALALEYSGSVVQAAILGNVAAAVACESEGNCPVRTEAMLEKLARLEGRCAT
jgi:rfaE bifunctional protein kinase chain/domain/rfaE bifunctional protein nucleotidyltransferase chain/domain